MRDFPLDQYALRAAAMARCAPESRYFPLLDMLFKQQANWTSAEAPIAAIKQIGRLAGIRGEAADACMSDAGLLDRSLKIRLGEIGRAHVRTPVTNAHLGCRLLLDANKT